MTGRHKRFRVTLPDLVLSQPFEFCISISLFIMGLGSLNTISSLSEVVENVAAQVLFWVWTVVVLVGAAAIVASFLLSPRAERMGLHHVTKNRTLERAGLVLLATAASAYAAVVVMVNGASGMFTLGAMGGVTAACGLRMWALRRADLRTLSWLRTVRERVDYAQDES